MSNLAGSQSCSGASGAGRGGGAAGSSSHPLHVAATKGAGVVGNLVGQAKAMFGSHGDHIPRTREKGRQDSQVRLRSPAPGKPGPCDRTERSRSPARRNSGQPPLRARQFGVQLSLWALVIVTITGGLLFYREHERYVDEQSQGEIVIAGPDPVPDVQVPVSPEPVEVVAPADAGATIGPAEAGSLNSLRSEVALLRQVLDRHDKMLRYIMNRYVEKAEMDNKVPSIDTGGSASAEAHDAGIASAVNLSKSDMASSDSAGAGSEPASRVGLRKQRSGGGDAVGVPGMEGLLT